MDVDGPLRRVTLNLDGCSQSVTPKTLVPVARGTFFFSLRDLSSDSFVAALLHTILFHRALGASQVVDVHLDMVDVCYVRYARAVCFGSF